MRAMQTTTLARDRYVHHGKLDVPRDADREYVVAKSYLSRDPLERALFRKLEHPSDDRDYVLSINHRNEDYFDPRTNTIGWDPYSALRTTSGGRQSPALGLGHEVDHAVENRAKESRLMNHFDARYDNAEERRVIRGSETHAAHTLGEGVRHDHGGSVYRVSSPMQR
jgi:hypothetical protein